MNDRFRRIDYFTITVFGFATSALWSSLHSIVLPLRLLDFVGEAQKNTYLGLLTFAGLVLAIIIQPVAGSLSDSSSLRWGRRRPFILGGTLAALMFLPGIGLAQTFAMLFAAYCLLQVSANIAQGPYQALIPDLVPTGKRGLASGVKTLLEMLGGLALVRLIGYLMGKYSAGGGTYWLGWVLGSLGAVLLAAMLATILSVKEKPLPTYPRLAFFPGVLRRSFRIDIKAKPDFILFLVSRLLIIMALTTLQTFALYFLRDVIGVSNPAEVTADLLIVVGIGMLTIVYPAGRLTDRIGRRPVGVFAGFLGALGIVVFFLAADYARIMFGGAIIGIATGAFMSSNWALATDLASKGEEARYLGLTNLATAGGSALARLAGPGIDFFNQSAAGLGYQLMLGACFIYFVVGAILLLRIKVQPK